MSLGEFLNFAVNMGVDKIRNLEAACKRPTVVTYNSHTTSEYMENEATFIAPEGVYTVTEEHKPSIFQPITIGPPAPFFPTRVSCVVVRYPQLTKQGATAGLAQLLGGGNKDGRKDKAGKEKDKEKDRDDGVSLSSSDTPDEGETTAVGTTTDASTAVHPEQHTLFSQSSGGKKKGQGRPKHNIKTTSSTFITRVHSTDANLRALSSKQGDITFLFFNTGKNFVWLEAASKVKVGFHLPLLFLLNKPIGTAGSGDLCCQSNVPRRQPHYGCTRSFRCHYWFQHRRLDLAGSNLLPIRAPEQTGTLDPHAYIYLFILHRDA